MDILGNILSVGDYVVYPDGRGSKHSLLQGRILRVGAKMVIIETVDHPRGRNGGEYRRYFEDVLRIQR
jgi:hypothetical protein